VVAVKLLVKAMVPVVAVNVTVPSLTVPLKVRPPEFVTVRAPAPLMLLATVVESVRSNTSVPLLLTAPLPSAPDVPPLPICSVPAVIVVAPV